MRLKDDVDAAVVTVAGGAEGGADFGRVVSVVVNHGDAAHGTLDLEAPVNAAKVLYPLRDGLGFQLQLVGDGHCGCRVENIVEPGHVKLEGAEHVALRASIYSDFEAGTRSFSRRQQAQDIVGAGVGSVGEDFPADAGQDGGKLRIVEAGHAGSVKGHAVHEVNEGILDVGHVAVTIHVFAIEVGDNGENGRQLQEGAVALVGLRDEVLRLAEAGVRSHRIDPAAHNYGGVKTSGGQHGGDHGCGRGLAVHTGNGDSILEAHELGEHFCALDDGDFSTAGFDDLRVALVDGGACDDDSRADNVGGGVALEDGRAERRQPFGDGGVAQARATDGITEVEEDLGDTAHADAADSDEVGSLWFQKHDADLKCLSYSNSAVRRC